MITPSRVLAAAKSLAASQGGSLSERIERLDIAGRLETPELFEEWRQIAEGIDANIGTLTVLDVLGDPIDLRTADRAEVIGATLRVIIQKPNSVPSVVRLFGVRGLVTLLESTDAAASVRRVFIAEAFEPFSTLGCAFERWETGTTLGPDSTAAAADSVRAVAPRRVVKDLAGKQVPPTIGIWLLDGIAPPESEVFKIWRRIATQRLLVTLVNEVWREEGELMVTLSGPRTRRLKAGLDMIDVTKVFELATMAALWVYASGRDIDVRHTLLGYELAREWPEDVPWGVGFAQRLPHALDSAQTAFRAHVQETSKDTLKALAELRKAVNEETGKVAQQTRDLISMLWRDFVIAIGAIGIRVGTLLSGSVAKGTLAVQVLLVGTAAFLIYSITLTLRTNARFTRIGESNRADWHSKLYGLLSAQDFDVLVNAPIKQVQMAYHTTKRWIIAAYFVVVSVLLAIAATDADLLKASPGGISIPMIRLEPHGSIGAPEPASSSPAS